MSEYWRAQSDYVIVYGQFRYSSLSSSAYVRGKVFPSVPALRIIAFGLFLLKLYYSVVQ
jgi:hypothetical protein